MDFASLRPISVLGASQRAAGMITFEPITIALMPSRDSKGMLVRRDGLLVAVIVQLEDDGHGEAYIGKWHFEATFGELHSPVPQVFSDLNQVRRWIEQKVGVNAS